jgi:hypothetical protein
MVASAYGWVTRVSSMVKRAHHLLYSNRYTQIRDVVGAVEEVVDPNSMVRKVLNSFTKPWGPFVRDIVSREVMPTWERMRDNFVQEETRLVAEASGPHQQQPVSSDEDLALWTKGKKKTGRVPSLGPHHEEERAAAVGKRET